MVCSGHVLELQYNSRNEKDTEGKANDVYDVSNSQNYEVNNVTITYKKK